MKIMRIEHQVNSVSKDMRYKRIQENIKKLKDSYGRSEVRIGTPEDMDKSVIVRKNSVDAKAYLKTFELMLYEYDVLMLELRKKKETLRKELFV